MQPSITRETIVDRRQPVIRWGAVFAGVFVSVGLWVLLQTLGLGIGLSAIDPRNAGSLHAVGVGTTIWSLVAPLIAMFIGGIIAARFATTFSRGTGALHGLVVWAIAAIAGVLATVSFVSAIASGAVAITKAAAEPVMNAAQSAAGHVNLDVQDLLGPINQKLQQEGKPAVTAEQLGDVTKSMLGELANGGTVDHAALVRELANNTQMSQQDAEDVANQLEQRYQGMRHEVGRAGERAQRAALQAADATGKALLFGGLSLLLSLVTAMIGGVIGVHRRRSDEDEYTRIVKENPPPPSAPAVITASELP